jgi:general transcription factor 3C polypeptide 3 (transcription factor C subunit 4)
LCNGMADSDYSEESSPLPTSSDSDEGGEQRPARPSWSSDSSEGDESEGDSSEGDSSEGGEGEEAGEERVEGDDDDEDDVEDQIGRFLDYAEDIPTALKDLTGLSMEVAQNMSMGGYLQGGKVRNLSQTVQGKLRKTRSSRREMSQSPEQAGALPDFSDSESDYQEDEWDDAQAEAMGLTPAANRRAEKRRHSNKLKRLQAGKSSKGYGMPEQAVEMLGSGNMKYVEGNYQEAEKLFMDCIRQAPSFPDAYSSLSRLYEETGDAMKSMNFLMAAAFFTKKDAEIWKDCARKSRENLAHRQAVFCYNQVIRREKDMPQWRRERGLTMVNLGLTHYKKALLDLKEYNKLAPDDSEVVECMARVYDEMGNIDEAIQIMDSFIKGHPEQVGLTSFNILAELLMKKDHPDWHQIVELINKARREYLGGNQLPIELESKEAVAFINMDKKELADEIASRFLENPVHTVEAYEDVFKLFAESYKAGGMHEAALVFYERLACYPWSVASHWKSYVEVCSLLNKSSDPLAEQINAWKKILEHASKHHPNYVDAVVELADMLDRHGDTSEAMQYLEILQDGEVQPYAVENWTVDEMTYLKRAKVFMACGKDQLYVQYFLNPVIKSLRLILLHAETSKSKKGRKSLGDEALPSAGDDLVVWETSDEKRRKKGADVDEFAIDHAITLQMADVPVFENLVRDRKNFDTILYLVKILLEMDAVADAFTVCDLTVTVLARKHPNKERRDLMKIQLAECCCRMRDWSNALKHIKGPADTPEGSVSPQVWNIFTKIAIGVGGVRQTSKYITSMRKKYPVSLPIALLSGHAKLQANEYGAALGEYLDAYRIDPDEPLVKLCISNLFTNFACDSKHCRDLALVHAFAWMQEYGRSTGNAAEAAYNAGRIAQQFSMQHLAVPLYRESLYHLDAQRVEEEMRDMMEAGMQGRGGRDGTPALVAAFSRSIAEGHGLNANSKGGKANNDLSREAAFNLSLILMESNAHELAREVRRRYLRW